MARKILLADDSVTAQNMGRKILADAGYEVITVNNGSAALKKIAEQKPDLIVLDVYMPGYSGLEVCQRLKEAQETARLPILLTVGKLEPFKPEEAKRVRADAFIVKPFEASELLSALSKLEDKIVPRAEASKPGRFARVTAAIEESRYDKTVAIKEDLGWKNRISFPAKEKHAAVDGERTAFANSSPAERKPLEIPHATKAEEARVDLGALAPEGLPKDVTPEEIAALAAAAAQVKGKMAELTEPPPAPTQSEEIQHTEIAPPQELSATVVAPVTEQKIEEKFEEKPEKIDAAQEKEKSSEAAAEADSVAASMHSDLMAAIAGMDPRAAGLPDAPLADGFAPHETTEQTAHEAVTMALTAGAGALAEVPRWTAVSVPLDKEEAAISLEQEMQKTYAAFAAAVNAHTSSDSVVPDPALDSVKLAVATESSTSSQPALPEPAVSIPAMPAVEVTQTLSPLGNGSTEAIRAAVQDLEMVGESYPTEATTPVGLGPVSIDTGTPLLLAQQATQAVEAIAESPSTTAEQPQAEAANLDAVKHDEASAWHQEPKSREWKYEDRRSEDRRNNEDRRTEDRKNEEPFVSAPAIAAEENHEATPETHEIPPPTFVNEVPAELSTANPVSSFLSAGSPAQPAAEGTSETAKKETDEGATTAAAWASWQRVRDSGDSNGAVDELTPRKAEETSTPQDSAAMAVAAGAEKAPEPAESESDPAAIASIVDSVLADLRPKIFEELSRKMGKKK